MKPGTNRARRNGLVWIGVCAVFSIVIGVYVGNNVPGGTIGFQSVYYGTRCLLRHCDPYHESELTAFYRAQAGGRSVETAQRQKAVTLYVNLPSTFLFVAPLAALPWGPAHTIWSILIVVAFLLASILMWDVGARAAPGISLLLVCILVSNSEVVFATGNTAGLVVSLGVIAAWCLITERFVPAGVLCLAASLAIKPHDTGLIWLYFLLAGGAHRKRALQALAITAALGIAGFLWVSHIAPHWLPEMRSNLAAIAAPGGINEPGPGSVTGRGPTLVIDLQSILSIFFARPAIYNAISYLVCGALLIGWSVKTVRTRFSQESAWIALAAIAALTLLPTYHRPYDAKLLLLAVPACTMLWAARGPMARVALIVTLAGIAMTGDLVLALLALGTMSLAPAPAMGFGLKLLLVAVRPIALILLAVSIVYLVIYFRRASPQDETIAPGSRADSPVSASAPA